MEKVTIKRKEYNVVSEINEHTFKVEKDGVFYFAKQFAIRSQEFYDFQYNYKKIKNAGVMIPKLIRVDKSSGFFLLEWIEGKTIFDELLEHDLDDQILEKIFEFNYKCRVNKIAINFNPQNYVISNNVLYLLNYETIPYARKDDFSECGIRLWTYTREFRELLQSKGLKVDLKRVRPEYEENKALVLTVIKFYR